MRSFVIAVLAASAYAQDTATEEVPPISTMDATTMDDKTMKDDMDNMQAIDMMHQLMELFCDADEKDERHHGRDGHKSSEEGESGDEKDGHMSTDGDGKKDKSDSDKDGSDSDSDGHMNHESRKNKWFCRQAKMMHEELTDYHYGSKDHKKHKARKWGGKMHDGAWDMFGWDAASTLSTYGTATVVAAALVASAF